MGKNCARGLEYGPRPKAEGRTQDQGHCYGSHCNLLLRDLRHCHIGSIPLCFPVVSLRVVGVIFHSV